MDRLLKVPSMPFSYFLTDFALSASNLAVHLVQFMTEDQRKQIEVIQVGAPRVSGQTK